jgi:hypothetical protein
MLLLLGVGEVFAAPPAPFTLVPEAPEIFIFREAGMAPLRPLADLYGATLTMAADGTATLTRQERTFICTPLRTAAQANGRTITLPQAPFECAGVLYAPLAPCVLALGGNVLVDATANRATVTLPGSDLALQMAFVSRTGEVEAYHDTDSELYYIGLDGSGLRRLTYDTHDDDLVAFSPDGTQLATNRDFGLYLRRTALPQGNFRLRQTSSDGPFYTAPCFSADWTRTACIVSQAKPLQFRLLGVGTPEGDATLTVRREGESPQLSPDGKLLAYSAQADETLEWVIRVQDTRNGGVRTLTKGFHPQFTPDGKTLVFLRPYTCADGSSIRLLMSYLLVGDQAGIIYEPPSGERAANEFDADIRQDSAQIVFVRDGAGICVKTLDCTGVKQLTKDAGDRKPSYAHDGASIAFLRTVGAGRDLYVMRADGSDARKLPVGSLRVETYLFTPDSKGIVFSARPELPPPTTMPVLK